MLPALYFFLVLFTSCLADQESQTAIAIATFTPPTKPGTGKCYKSQRPIPEPAGDPKNPIDPQSCLASHNHYRSLVGLPFLSWSSQLASAAEQWAIKRNGVWSADPHDHSGTGQGENMSNGAASCPDAVRGFMAENKGSLNSLYLTQSNWRPIGHYSQVMWRETQQVGCGIYKGILVCRYYPPGNMLNRNIY